MEYLQILEKAIIYIEAHLRDTIKVEDVAHHIGYSYYHFARIFEASIGESVGNYIRKRRLASAAHMLIYTDTKVLDIALDFQFQSAEAFSRAFKEVYYISPQIYRRNRTEGLLGKKEPLTPLKLQHLINNVTLQPRIEKVAPIQVVGLRASMKLEDHSLSSLWDTFNKRMPEIKNIQPQARCFGICEYEENLSFGSFNDATYHHQLVAVQVTTCTPIPEDMVAYTIPGGTYAIFTHTGPISALRATYNYIWGTWLPASKVMLDKRPDFEVYDERFLGRTAPLSQLDLYVPIKATDDV